MARPRPHPRGHPPPRQPPDVPPPIVAQGVSDRFGVQTLRALNGLTDLMQGGGDASPSYSRYLQLPSSPTLGTMTLRGDAFYRITGFTATPSVNIAITKNGMTVASGGLLADSAGNIISAPIDIGGGVIIWVGTTQSSQSTMLGLNFVINPGEILYVSKNQAAAVWIMLYYKLT